MPNAKGQPVITVDGTSAAGKSTLSKRLAEQYGGVRLEFSLIFRMIGKHMCEQGFVPAENTPLTPAQIEEATRYAASITWHEVENTQRYHHDTLRSPDVSAATPFFAGLPGVIDATNGLFRQLIDSSPKPVIAEGRAIGRHIYPNADVKLYVDADVALRGARRAEEMRRNGMQVTDEETTAGLMRRDKQDQERAYQPTGFDPAVQIKLDTSTHSAAETLANATAIIQTTLPQLASLNPNISPKI